jgi:hypothetical protein
LSTQDREYPIDDLGSPEDEEIQIKDVGASDEEIPVHDLDATDDDVSIADLDSLVEEVVVLDLDAGGESGEDLATLIEEVAARDGTAPGAEARDAEKRDEQPEGSPSPASDGDAPTDAEEPSKEDGEIHDLGGTDDDVALQDLAAPDDEVDVFDLSATADRDSVLAEALAHSATLEAQYQQPLPETRKTGLWKTPLALVVFVLAGYLVVFPPPWLQGDPLPDLDPAAKMQGVHASLYLQAQQVEAFRLETGRLPNSIEEMDLAFEGLRYVRSNNRIYQLVLPGPQGTYVVFDSAHPSDAVLSVPEAWGVYQP